MRAIVLYRDSRPGLLPRLFLKPGFRHCAVLIDDGEYWVAFDHGRGQPLIRVVADAEQDVAAHYRAQPDYEVQEVEFDWRDVRYRASGPHSCVTSIKSMLGIRAFWVLTPYQLYRWLEKNHARRWCR